MSAPLRNRRYSVPGGTVAEDAVVLLSDGANVRGERFEHHKDEPPEAHVGTQIQHEDVRSIPLFLPTHFQWHDF
jgi:hypothetical protein